MSEPFVGEIRVFGFDFAPRGWARCDGQLLEIRTYPALFSLLGTRFGGDGRTTFGIPDLRGRVPLGVGSGPGLSPYQIGQSGGAETVALTVEQLPSHGHGVAAESGRATARRPGGRFWARVRRKRAYADTSDVQMNADAVQPAGGDQPHPNLPPYLALTYAIALTGIYPSRS